MPPFVSFRMVKSIECHHHGDADAVIVMNRKTRGGPRITGRGELQNLQGIRMIKRRSREPFSRASDILPFIVIHY